MGILRVRLTEALVAPVAATPGVRIIASGLEAPWALAFTPDGAADGRIRRLAP